MCNEQSYYKSVNNRLLLKLLDHELSLRKAGWILDKLEARLFVQVHCASIELVDFQCQHFRISFVPSIRLESIHHFHRNTLTAHGIVNKHILNVQMWWESFNGLHPHVTQWGIAQLTIDTGHDSTTGLEFGRLWRNRNESNVLLALQSFSVIDNDAILAFSRVRDVDRLAHVIIHTENGSNATSYSDWNDF